MGIKYLSGPGDFGWPWGSKPELPVTKNDYTIGAVFLIGNQITLSRQPLFDQYDHIKPILGLGLRKSLKKLWSNGSILQVDLNKDISTLTELEKNMMDNKTGAAVLGLAGMALAGPVGLLAGLAAKKKGEVIFAMEFRSNCSEPFLNDKVIVLSADDAQFQTIKRISKAPSKGAKEYISSQFPDQGDSKSSISAEIEKLSSLKDSGAISEEEFAAAKAKLLDL